MDSAFWTPIISGGILAAIAGFFSIRTLRAQQQDKKLPSWVELDKSNRELRTDLDKLNDRFDEFVKSSSRERRAMQNVLYAAADQWPQNSPGPVLNPYDLEVLSDTIPASWRPPIAPPRPAT